MWLFSSKKYKSLSHAVLAGDIRAVRKMLVKGADPNKCDPNDNAYPIHYALNHGPKMVQLLVDYGVDVNVPSPRNDAMPLAFAEAHGYTDVALILKKAGARLRKDFDELNLDPRLRLQIEPKIRLLVVTARQFFPKDKPEHIAKHVEEKLNLEFPNKMSPEQKEQIRMDIHALILKACGIKNYLDYTKKRVASPEEVMRKTGMSEDELTRRFLEHLIQQGKNPFKDMPQHFLQDAENKFPDLVLLARRKFGTNW